MKVPKFIGHRGASGFAPENTLAAMRIAKERGAEWVEFDVKQTKDGHLIIMHDEDVKRTTNGVGRVVDMTLDEIRQLDAGSWFKPEFAHEKVPTLGEIFEVLEELNLCANIEIKPCPGTDVHLSQNVVNFIKNNWSHNLPKPLVSSFSLEVLRVARAMDPTLQIGFLCDHPLPENWKDLAQELSASAICLNHKSVTSSDVVKEMHELGYVVLTYTVNQAARAKELYSMGVDSVFTNYPGMT